MLSIFRNNSRNPKMNLPNNTKSMRKYVTKNPSGKQLCFIAARSELWNVLLVPSICCFCLCMKYIGRQIHTEDVLGPSIGRVWRSRSEVKVTRDKKTFLSVACVRFMFGKASLGSSYNCFMCVHLRWAWRSSSRDVYQNSLFARDLICSEALLNCWVLSNELRFYVSDRQKILVILETFFPASLMAYYWNSKAVYRKPANDDLVSCYELLM